jgi:hypothetical protein
MEGFSSDTVLDWIRKGILKLRVVPDMIYGGSVDVGTVPVEKSVVWRTMFAEGTDGLFIYTSDTPNRLNSLNLTSQYYTVHDKWKVWFGRNLSDFELSGKILS